MNQNNLLKPALFAVLFTLTGALYAQISMDGGNTGVGTATPLKKFEIKDGNFARFTFSGASSTTLLYEVAQTMDNAGYKLNVNHYSRNYKVAIGGLDRFKILSNENYSFGSYSMMSLRYGEHNIGFGQETLTDNRDGHYNVALGFKALYSNYDGSWNIALGLKSLRGNTNGNYNIALGNEALFTNSTGSYNIALGNYLIFVATLFSVYSGIQYFNANKDAILGDK